MRIANWNVERVLPRQRRATAVRKHLAEVAADIYVLTETHLSLSPCAGLCGVFSGTPDRRSEAGERWASIWSACALEPLDDYVSDSCRCVAARLPDTTVGEVVVYACVLPWLSSTWRGLSSAGGIAFGAALDLCSRDWKRLAKKFPQAVIVVAGDFNQDLAPRHYYGSAVQRKALRDALEEANLTAVTGDAGDPIATHSPPYACIDHICISRSVGITHANPVRWPDVLAPDRRLSDHFGLAVDLTRRY